MGDPTYIRLAEAVLVAHQRRDDGNCLCGGLMLGDSWATHVAELLHAVGALRDGPPPKEQCIRPAGDTGAPGRAH
jgi:hypothetical protein